MKLQAYESHEMTSYIFSEIADDSHENFNFIFSEKK